MFELNGHFPVPLIDHLNYYFMELTIAIIYLFVLPLIAYVFNSIWKEQLNQR